MSEKCAICGNAGEIIYDGPIKYGLLEGYTSENHKVFQCKVCKTIWNHAQEKYSSEFYESEEYRTRIEGNSQIETYYYRHDREVLDKLNITGTDIFRNKTIADIGCGGGSFLDFANTVARTIVAIEPSRTYRTELEGKGYHTFSYATEAILEWKGKCDVVTSFDVIEHVKSPEAFAKDMFDLCAEGGQVICGTPTDYPVLRELLGDRYNKFIFQIQHPWILSEKSLLLLFERAGFRSIKIEKIQKYGLGNLIAWLNEGKPRGDIKYDFISDAMNEAYKAEMARQNPEYLVVKALK